MIMQSISTCRLLLVRELFNKMNFVQFMDSLQGIQAHLMLSGLSGVSVYSWVGVWG